MPRSGMTTLIALTRHLTNAGTAEATLGSVTYFTDDHMQAELDRTARVWRRVPLERLPVLIDGAYQYFDYAIPPQIGAHFEEAGADSGWALKDGTGATIGTALYTVNHAARRLSFSSDQGGSLYYLDARSYDPHRAAAAIWRHKAGFAAARVDWESDNHHIQAAQEYEHCLRMAAHYDALAGATTGRFFRADELTHE
jgi:hypothetical protein